MLVSCSAWQAKQSHLNPSQPTMRSNRTSAEKTVLSTSARWAAGPPAEPVVYLKALIAAHISSAVYFSKLGLHVMVITSFSPWETEWNLTGIELIFFSLSCWSDSTNIFHSHLYYMLSVVTFTSPYIFKSNNRSKPLSIYTWFCFSPSFTDWPPLHEEDPTWCWGIQCAGRGARLLRAPCGGLCPPSSSCTAQWPGWSSHHHQVISKPRQSSWLV